MRTRLPAWIWSACLALLGTLGPGVRADDELDAHLKTLRRQSEDRSVPLARREALVLEMAATLDRAAQAAPTAEARRAHWSEAIRELDDFRQGNPGHPLSDQFNVQAAIYSWAQAQGWKEQWEFDPEDRKARDQARAALDAALARLNPVYERTRKAEDATAQNVRFRLAQALIDRADLDPEGAEERPKRIERASNALKAPISEPSLQGFAHLLRGELLGRLGRFEPALQEIEAAALAKSPPPRGELLEARVQILLGEKRFADSLKAIASAPLDEVTKHALAVRSRLAERASLASGSARSAVETALFQELKTLRSSSKPEARRALLSVARAVPEPDAAQGPDAWESLAEGALALGQAERAGRCAAQAADRAQALGDRPRAAEFRLQAGAYLFQAQSYSEADTELTRVLDDAGSQSIRARAGLLRALARGRALALGRPGATRHAYEAALEGQLRDFPTDPSTGEARWLLGRLQLAQGRRKEALQLWSAIAAGSPRWRDSRLAVARLNQDDLDMLRIANDHDLVKARFQEARRFLADSRDQAGSDSERNELDLCLARLELTPDLGKPEAARAICERILKSATPADLRIQTARLQLVALAELHRYVEAERFARAEITQTLAPDLLETARLLDETASASESDLLMRRFGLLMRVLLKRALEHEDELSPEGRWEAKLRLTRAQLFSGNTPAAQNSLGPWSEALPPTGDHFARDLADTYFRLEAYELAIDVQRLRARRLPTGSLLWFDARYGLALAYFRAGKEKEARQLIDATAILHPELGGGDLRDKNVRLRQRLNPG